MRFWPALLVVLAGSCLAVATDAPPAMAPDAFVAELDRLLAATEGIEQRTSEIQPLLETIPAQWTVATEGRAFDISTAWLPSELRNLQQKPSAEVVRKLRDRLSLMRREALAFQESSADRASERATLRGILARREFRRVHGPTALDRMRQRIYRVLFDLLGRIFGSKALPTASRILVWSLVALAVGVLAVWIFQSFRRSVAMESIMPQSFPHPAKPWSEWMAEARAAAAQGDWRNAIHLAYWAGIAFLEMQRLWRPDRTRTPREYLRVLPASSPHRPALAALTRQFEVVWYGSQDADARLFAQTLAQLEKLGCRSS